MIFASLRRWGFEQVLVFNLHGDQQHGQTILEAVQAARRDLGLDVRCVLARYALRRFGLNGQEPYLVVQNAPYLAHADTHAGGSETGQFAAFFPQLADLELAKTLPPQSDGFQPLGYWGDPAQYNIAEARQFFEEYGRLTADAIENVLPKA
jgi:creatinine amidohydrolase